MAYPLRGLIGPAVLFMLILAAPARAEEDQDRALRLRESGEIVSLEEILAAARDQTPGRVLNVELEERKGGILYELEILAADGGVWEMTFDARTGRLLSSRKEED